MWVIAAFGKFASVFKLHWRMASPPNGAFGCQTVLSAFAAATQLLPQSCTTAIARFIGNMGSAERDEDPVTPVTLIMVLGGSGREEQNVL